LGFSDFFAITGAFLAVAGFFAEMVGADFEDALFPFAAGLVGDTDFFPNVFFLDDAACATDFFSSFTSFLVCFSSTLRAYFCSLLFLAGETGFADATDLVGVLSLCCCFTSGLATYFA
jgi:hypothetical protein